MGEIKAIVETAKKAVKNYRITINPPYSRKDIPVLALTVILFVGIGFTVFASVNVRDFGSKAAAPNLSDLGVNYIERTPRYPRYQVCYNPSGYNPYLCGGQKIADKRWPEKGDSVKFTAYVKNHGTLSTSSTEFEWYIDDVLVKTGQVTSLQGGEEFTDTLDWIWDHVVINGRVLGDHKVKFVVDPQNNISEVTKNNNILEDYTNALAFRFHVEQSVYDYLGTQQNAVGSYSFEDWAQFQVGEMNRLFSEAVTPFAPNGIEERVRLDEIVIVPDDSLPKGGTHAPGDMNWDGRWGFNSVDFYQRNPQYISGIESPLIHELGHQIGLIDGYNLDIQGGEVLVEDGAGNLVAGNKEMPYENNTIVHHGGCNDSYPDCFLRGIMDAGSGKFTPHNVGSLNANKGFRRGYYGEFLMDVPDVNKVIFTDRSGKLLKNVLIEVYQQKDNKVANDIIYSGISDNEGSWTFPKKSVTTFTTLTGHTQTSNPFGPINVVGVSSVFALKLTYGEHTEFHWMDIFDFNAEYWKGNTDGAEYTISMDYDPRSYTGNVALNKETLASSSTSVGLKEYANDGDKSDPVRVWDAITNGPGEWWQVDLGEVISLGKLSIYSWATNGHDWHKEFHVDISETGEFSGEEITVVTETDWDKTRNNKQAVTYRIDPKVSGRYVMVVVDNSQAFTLLQEVEVFGVNDSGNDDTPPDVLITSPEDGDIVSNETTVTAQVEDNVGISRVDFYVDGVLKSTDTLSPYVYSWNTKITSNGNHSLIVKAYDEVNNEGTSSSVQVKVQNDLSDNQNPTAPTNLRGKAISGTRVDLNWGASTDNVGVSGYRVYRNNTLIKRVVGRTYSDRSAKSSRTYTYYVQAYDAAGNISSKSNLLRITMSGSGTPKKLGDINGDGKINIFDLSTMLSKWKSTNKAADLNNSGRVDIFDLSILLSRWGR